MTTLARTGAAAPITTRSIDPANDRVVDPRPFVRSRDGADRLELIVFGARCAGCIAKIEGAMKAIDGVSDARLNLSTGRLSLSWPAGAVVPRRLVESLNALGYRTAPFDAQKSERASDDESRMLLRCLAVAGFAAANIMLLSVSVWSGADGEMGEATRTLLHWISAAIAIPAVAYCGRPFFRSAWSALRAGRANMDVPISLGVMLALALSIAESLRGGEHAYFDAAVMLLFFLLIGRYLDCRLRLRARAAARDLLSLQAATAMRMLEDGAVETILAREVRVGDRVVLQPGDRAPVDSEIIEGGSNVDLSLVTGESAPARRVRGDLLSAGVLNLSSRLIVRALKTADQSLIAELARLLEASEAQRGQYRRLADRAAALYVPIVHSLAAATFIAWYFLADAGLRIAMMNAIAVLIITCPCALGLAAPAVQIVATGRLFRQGILAKSGDALERLAEVDTVVFDKTGTLTHGRLSLSEGVTKETPDFAEAAMLARASRHPLSRAIAAAAGVGPVADSAKEFEGCGVEGVINGARARLGKASWVGVHAPESDLTEVWYAREDATPMRLTFDDALRSDAVDVVSKLRRHGLNVLMLSGDQNAPARRVAASLGEIAFESGLLPTEKIARIEALERAGKRVAMIGDGLNDAPALAAAHASLAPGAAADVSQSAADFVYQGERLGPVVEAICVSRLARRRMAENFTFAALYNLLAAPLAAFGYVTPLIAALAMSGSSILVTLNALRLARMTQR
jgi:Cu2+-exporting ATPase